MSPDQIFASLSQLGHQKRPVTLIAIVFFSLVCLSLGGMQAWSVYKARDVKLKESTVAAANTTRNMADHAGNALDLLDLVLSEVVERVRNDGAALDGATVEAARLQHYMAERVARTPLLEDLAVYRDNGELALSSALAPALPARLEAGAADQHRYHLAHPGDALRIGAPQRHAVSGEWVLPLSRRWSMPEGGFGGIVSGSLRIQVLEDFYKDREAAGGTLQLALTSGQLVLSWPAAGHDTGKDLRGSALFQGWRQSGAAGHAFLSEPGKPGAGAHLYSYRPLKSYPLIVGVAQPASAILQDWWESAYLSSAGVSLLMLIQLWLGVRLYGQIALRDRLEVERRSLQKLLVDKSRSLRKQALKDALTGIANRRQFDTRLFREFGRAAADSSPIALVMLDVDYFKKYNDQHGHPAGDECLKMVAGCVNNGRRRSQDLAARMGGEEFAILLPNTGLRGAIAVAEAVRKTVAARTMHHISDLPHTVTVSCGVHALIPVEGMTPADLVDAADRALYLAKTSGRNRVRAEGDMPSSAKRFSLVVNK